MDAGHGAGEPGAGRADLPAAMRQDGRVRPLHVLSGHRRLPGPRHLLRALPGSRRLRVRPLHVLGPAEPQRVHEGRRPDLLAAGLRVHAAGRHVAPGHGCDQAARRQPLGGLARLPEAVRGHEGVRALHGHVAQLVPLVRHQRPEGHRGQVLPLRWARRLRRGRRGGDEEHRRVARRLRGRLAQPHDCGIVHGLCRRRGLPRDPQPRDPAPALVQEHRAGPLGAQPPGLARHVGEPCPVRVGARRLERRPIRCSS
mmetsp:Transcript_70878/g.198776  ORF Transcript_70878/g.198776 Transcript_70878/m.198776 type:complete len:255 (-) Transcript_70878:24-788(-)